MANKAPISEDLVAALEERYFLVPKSVAKWLAPTVATVLAVGGWSGIQGIIGAAKSAALESAVKEANLAATEAVKTFVPREVQERVDASVASVVASAQTAQSKLAEINDIQAKCNATLKSLDIHHVSTRLEDMERRFRLIQPIMVEHAASIEIIGQAVAKSNIATQPPELKLSCQSWSDNAKSGKEILSALK